MRAAGARFGYGLADAGYGTITTFRHALDERDLLWAVGISRNQKVYGADMQLVPPTGRARKPVPDQEPQAGVVALAQALEHDAGHGGYSFDCEGTIPGILLGLVMRSAVNLRRLA